MSPSISSLVRRMSTALASDLSGKADLLELTFALVLRNLLTNVQRFSTRIDLILRVIVPYIILLGGIYGTFGQVPTFRGIISDIASLWNLATASFTSRITVPADHFINANVLAWITTRQVPDARGLVLIRKLALPTVFEFIPHSGKTRFRYKGYFMSMDRANDGTADKNGELVACHDPTAPQNLTLECFPSFRGTNLLKEFLEDVSGFSKPLREDTTTVYRPHKLLSSRSAFVMTWIPAVARPSRSLESVALESSKKDALVADIAYYLTPECQLFYANRGYPYRRGFLLYGPPGTGKTSFCLALAGHFNLDLYIVSLSDDGMTDEGLESLFHYLPSHCIVLMEDVDSAGLEREVVKAETNKHHRSSKSQSNPVAFEAESGLTLSGLLNCLDGPTSKDGRILCMTSNSPDNLDPALVRPGRCDQKVHFGYANEEICVKLFEHLYTKTSDELLEGETSASAQYDIALLAKDFASAIPSGSKISPVEVQGYLMIHRRDPVAAVEGAQAFAKDIIEVKARAKNVADHANKIEKNE
jgi:chaperone BCS1